MVVGDGAVQRVDEGRARGLEPPPRQVGEPLGAMFPAINASRIARPLTPRMTHHGRELQIGVLQDLLEPQRVLGDLADELFAGPREIAQLSNRACIVPAATPLRKRMP